jgi:hypothetical protein
MPITKLKEDKPQGLFITPDEQSIDLFDTYLKKSEKVEGLSKEEYMRKALNNEKEFEYDPTDDD